MINMFNLSRTFAGLLVCIFLGVSSPQAEATVIRNIAPIVSNSEYGFVNVNYFWIDHPNAGDATYYYYDYGWGDYILTSIAYSSGNSRWEIYQRTWYGGQFYAPVLMNAAPSGLIPETGWTDMSGNASATVIDVNGAVLPDQLKILGTSYAFSNPGIVFNYEYDFGYRAYDGSFNFLGDIFDNYGDGYYWYINDASNGYVYSWFSGTPSFAPPLTGWVEYYTGNPAPGVTVCYVPCESPVTLVKDRGDNEPIGTTYEFTAGGGASPTGYAFSISGGTTWIVQQDSASTTWNWDTTGQLAGAKTIRVVAHDAGGMPVGDVVTQTVTLFKPSTLGVSITANKLSPQVRGTTVSFTYKAVGGTNPTKEFEALMRYPNGIWYPMMSYSTTSVWNWNTTGMPVGTYYLKVRSREAGFNLAAQGEKTIPFALK